MIGMFAGRRRLAPQRFGDGPLGRGETLREAFWNRPPWADGLLARRVLAGVLAVAAVVLLLRGDPDTDRARVVVAACDLAPGHLLTSSDLRVADREAGTLPGGAARDPGALVGATLTGAMRTGEILTDLRVIGPRLAAVAGGARMPGSFRCGWPIPPSPTFCARATASTSSRPTNPIVPHAPPAPWPPTLPWS